MDKSKVLRFLWPTLYITQSNETGLGNHLEMRCNVFVYVYIMSQTNIRDG